MASPASLDDVRRQQAAVLGRERGRTGVPDDLDRPEYSQLPHRHCPESLNDSANGEKAPLYRN